MWEKKPQTYDNHRRFVPPYHFVISAILLVYTLRAGWIMIRPLFSETESFSQGRVLGFAYALAILGIFFYTRDFALKAQDRIIRLEMRLRLREVLPEDVHGRIDELTTRQLIGLRFAGDDELEDLVHAAADHKLSEDQIKKQIKNWLPDYERV